MAATCCWATPPRRTYTDNNVDNGKRYYYVVTAVDAPGNESKWSNEASAVPHAPIGWAGHLWPPTLTITINATQSQRVYAQVWVDGVTNQPGQGAGRARPVRLRPDRQRPRDLDLAADGLQHRRGQQRRIQRRLHPRADRLVPVPGALQHQPRAGTGPTPSPTTTSAARSRSTRRPTQPRPPHPPTSTWSPVRGKLHHALAGTPTASLTSTATKSGAAARAVARTPSWPTSRRAPPQYTTRP